MTGPAQTSDVAVFDHSPDPTFVIDLDGRLRYLNVAAAEAIGPTATSWLGCHVSAFLHPDDLMLMASSLQSVQGKAVGTPVEMRVADPMRVWRWMEIIGRDCCDVPGIEGILCTARDLTQRRMWEVAANDVTRFQQVVHHAAAIVLSLDAAGVVTATNAALTRILGHDPSAVVGSPLSAWVAEAGAGLLGDALTRARDAGASSVELPMRRAGDGPPVPVRLEVVSLLDDPVVASFVVTGLDVSELHETRRRLEHLATHDPLTGLPNRKLLDERLTQLLAELEPVALLYVDLDRFKTVNDTLGHDAGDELLVMVARRLLGGLAGTDLVARVGGDEFVILAVGVRDDATATALATRLEEILRSPYELRAGAACVGASVGAVVARPGVLASTLLADADLAMYSAKALGPRGEQATPAA
jgi:diguanylate cyclase (GGDEF)-like protein/PAS domain S-box-containing protein